MPPPKGPKPSHSFLRKRKQETGYLQAVTPPEGLPTTTPKSRSLAPKSRAFSPGGGFGGGQGKPSEGPLDSLRTIPPGPVPLGMLGVMALIVIGTVVSLSGVTQVGDDVAFVYRNFPSQNLTFEDVNKKFVEMAEAIDDAVDPCEQECHMPTPALASGAHPTLPPWPQEPIHEDYVSTCTAKPTSDCVIETHKEDDEPASCAASSLRPTRCCTTTSGSRSPSAASPPSSRSSAPGITADHTSPPPLHTSPHSLPSCLCRHARSLYVGEASSTGNDGKLHATEVLYTLGVSAMELLAVCGDRRAPGSEAGSGDPTGSPLSSRRLWPPLQCSRAALSCSGCPCHTSTSPPSRSESRPAPTAPSSLPHISASPHALRVR